MDRFSRVLRRVDRRLQAPEPRRSRILMEMARDLEDLYRAYRDRGLSEREARRRAEEWLAPSGAALESLSSVHLPAFDRFLDRLGGTTRGRIELGLGALVSLAATGSGLLAALRSGAVSVSSPGLWIVAGLFALGMGLGAGQGYALFVRGDRLSRGWRRGLSRVAAAAAGTALAGVLAGALRLTVWAAPVEVGSAPAVLWSEIATASGVAALGLSASLLLALLWLVLRTRATVVDHARAELRETVAALEAETAGVRGETGAAGRGGDAASEDALQREATR